MSRTNLPYRETSDCFLLYKGDIVVQDKQHFLAFPGGGVDINETPIQSAKREIMEEVGGILDGKLYHITTIEWDWFPAWADTEKRKGRYKQFRGERIHLYVGKIKKFVKPTSTEGDAWKGKITMKLNKSINRALHFYNNAHPNEKVYKSTQLIILKMLKMFTNCSPH